MTNIQKKNFNSPQSKPIMNIGGDTMVDNSVTRMKEVYKKFFLPEFVYKEPALFGPKKQSFDKAAYRKKKEEEHKEYLQDQGKILVSDYLALKTNENSGKYAKLGFNNFLALKLYSGNDYQTINSFLREDKVEKDGWTKEMAKEIVKDINNGIQQILSKESTVYRGTTTGAKVTVDNKHVTIASLKENILYTEKGFTSTSALYKEAEEFAADNAKNHESWPAIITVNNLHSANITKLSKHKKEEERLLSLGTSFQVLSVEDEITTSLDDFMYDDKFEIKTSLTVDLAKEKLNQDPENDDLKKVVGVLSQQKSSNNAGQLEGQLPETTGRTDDNPGTCLSDVTIRSQQRSPRR